MSAKTVIDTYYASRFINLLRSDWTRWKAYRYGIIDRRGNVIKEPTTTRERSSWGRFDRLVAAIKSTLDKVPGASTAAAVYTGYKTFVEEYDINQETQEHIFEAVPELNNALYEAVVAGDSGYDAQNQAAGITSGAVTGRGALPLRPKKKKKLTKFADFVS